MPPIRSAHNRKAPPEGFDNLEDTLLEFSNKMKDAENASHEGKKRHEVLWPIFQITHQRTLFAFISHSFVLSVLSISSVFSFLSFLSLLGALSQFPSVCPVCIYQSYPSSPVFDMFVYTNIGYFLQAHDTSTTSTMTKRRSRKSSTTGC